MTDGEENYQRVKEGFRRLTGLAITVEIEANGEESGAIIPLLDGWYLPQSIDSHPKLSQPWLEEDQYGFVLSRELCEHGRKHCVRIPRAMWRLLKGKPRKVGILLWLYTRAWAAKSESLVKWEIIREQLWYDESNPRKLPGEMKNAVSLLCVMWPGANIRAVKDGLVFGRAKSYLIAKQGSGNRNLEED